MHSPRNRLLPSLERIVFAYLTTETKQGLAIKIAEGEPPTLHPHPHSSNYIGLRLRYHTTKSFLCQHTNEGIFIIYLVIENLTLDLRKSMELHTYCIHL